MELKVLVAQDTTGNILPNALVYLYQKSTEDLVSDIETSEGTPLNNPFNADENGLIALSAPNGVYDIRVVSGGRDFRVPVQFLDAQKAVTDIETYTQQLQSTIDEFQNVQEFGQALAENNMDIEDVSLALKQQIAIAKGQPIPPYLSLVDFDGSSATISWSNPSDADSFEIFQDGSSIGSSTISEATIENLATLTSYKFCVASDIDGILSDKSNSVTIVTTAEKDSYEGDFSGIADGTKLYDLEGWSVYNVGSTNDVIEGYQIHSETLLVSDIEWSTDPGAHLVARDLESTDGVFRVKLPDLTAANGSVTLCMASSNVDSALFVGFTVVSANDEIQNVVRVSKNVAGALEEIESKNIAGHPYFSVYRPTSGVVLEARVFGNFLNVFMNGIAVFDYPGVDVAGFSRATLYGFGTYNNARLLYEDVYMAALSAQLSVELSSKFYPGLLNEGADVAVVGSYAGALSNLEYRVIDSESLVEIQPWLAIEGANIEANTWSGTLKVPLNSLSSNNHRHRVQVRASNDVDVSTISEPFAAGITFGSYGQSNSALSGNGIGPEVSAEGAYVFNGTRTNPKWEGGAPSTNPGAAFGHQLSQFTDCPVGYVIAGYGAHTIEKLEADDGAPNGDKWDDFIADQFIPSGANELVYGWIWDQNEANASAVAAIDEPGYRALYTSIVSDNRLAGLSIDNAKFGVRILSTYETDYEDQAAQDEQWSEVRALQTRLTDIADTKIAASRFDLEHDDAYHHSGAGYAEANRRSALTLANAMGLVDYDGRGPIISGAARASNIITLPLNLNGADSISGSALTNYEVSTDSEFSTVETITSTEIVANEVVITLAANPGQPVYVRSFYGMKYNNPVFAHGLYSDGTTIPVEPLYTPIIST